MKLFLTLALAFSFSSSALALPFAELKKMASDIIYAQLSEGDVEITIEDLQVNRKSADIVSVSGLGIVRDNFTRRASYSVCTVDFRQVGLGFDVENVTCD